MIGLASWQGAGMGLTKGSGGLFDLLGHPFALGLRGEVGERNLLALGSVLRVIELGVGL